MAAGKLSPKFVCAEPCRHTDCAEIRRMAGELCYLCKTAIGFNTRFYKEDKSSCHALCLEKLQEKLRSARS